MKVVMATDGSPASHSAEQFLTELTIPDNSSVEIISVISSPYYASYGYEAIDISAQFHDSIARQIEEKLAESKKLFSEQGWNASAKSIEGIAAASIIEYAKEQESELIALGARGLSGVEKFLIGSVSSKVVRHAECPVLIHRNSEGLRLGPDRPLRVMVAHDGSESSQAAVDYLLAFPWKCPLEIAVVRVIELVTAFNVDAIQHASINWEGEVKLCQESLIKIQKQLKAISPAVETEVHQAATVSEELLRHSKEWQADLIVVGHQGHGAVMQFLLGSVAYRIAEHAECSVLVVR